MANRYIRHGETYNGDGNGTAAATYAGEPNTAYNDFWQTLIQTAGYTVSAGDVVYARSKTPGGSDITINITAAASIGLSSATETSTVTWVIDDGSVWAGITGTITVYLDGTTIYSVTLQTWNNFIANKQLFFDTTNNTSTSSGPIFVFNKSNIDGIVCNATNSNGSRRSITCSGAVTIKNSIFLIGNRNASLFSISYSATFINCEIELLTEETGESVFKTVGRGSVFILGGRIYGAGTTGGTPVVIVADQGTFVINGLKYPKTMKLNSTETLQIAQFSYAQGMDNGFGAEYSSYVGDIDSRDDNYYPKLNAQFEDSGNTKWSYKFYPKNAGKTLPLSINISKIYTQSAASKTITLEFLWPEGFSAPTSEVVWMEIFYTDDATGDIVNQTTFDLSASTLTTSTAGWSATTYSATNFSKYKLELTTSASIAQDTDVIIRFVMSKISATANDILFVDPDPVFS